jgi:hypothetical protein
MSVARVLEVLGRDDVTEPKPGPLSSEVALPTLFLTLAASGQLEGPALWSSAFVVAVAAVVRWDTKRNRRRVAVEEIRREVTREIAELLEERGLTLDEGESSSEGNAEESRAGATA